MKQEIKNYLYFLLLNTVFVITLYFLDFRMFIICPIMLMINTVFAFCLRNVNLSSFYKAFNDTKKDILLEKIVKNEKLTDEEKTKSLFFVKAFIGLDLKTNCFIYFNFYISLFLYLLLKKYNLPSFILILGISLLELIIFIYEIISLNLYIEYTNIKLLEIINIFVKASKKSFYNFYIKYFSKLVEKEILFIKSKKILLKTLDEYQFVKCSEKIEAEYENILDKTYNIKRAIEFNNKNLIFIDTDKFLKSSNAFINFLNTKNDEDEILNTIKLHSSYLDFISKLL